MRKGRWMVAGSRLLIEDKNLKSGFLERLEALLRRLGDNLNCKGAYITIHV